jgi:RNA polymerase sigma-70 factor (ECF subfamily)
MPDPSLHTAQLRDWLDRIRDGDSAAPEEVLRAACDRLERLARAMLRRFPKVRRWADTGDLLQNALLRLMRALREVRPASTRDFFNLAAVQMRRELLDLNRHFYGPFGAGAHHVSLPPGPDGPDAHGALAEAAEAAGADDLEQWSAFHEAVERLPAEEREVVGLKFYHGWKEAEIAGLFQVDARTIRRRWRAACLKLYEVLRGDVPELVT